MNEQIEALLKRKKILQDRLERLNSPGAWDYDADASFTRGCFWASTSDELQHVNNELRALGVEVE